MNYSLIVALLVFIKICAGDPGAINRIREHVLQWAQSNAHEVHQADLARVRSQDSFIGNYIKYHFNNEAKAQAAVIASLKYFKSEGFHDINDEYFPAEFHAAGLLHVGGTGLRKERLLSSLQRCLQSPVGVNGPDIYKLFMKWVLYNYFKLIQGDGIHAHIIHLMMKDAFPLNVDIPLTKDLSLSLIAHVFMHPVLYLISESTVLTEPLARLTMTILQIKNARYIKESDFSQYADIRTVPTLYSGLNATHWRMPAGAKSGRCLPHLSSVSAQHWTSFTTQNKGCILEVSILSGIFWPVEAMPSFMKPISYYEPQTLAMDAMRYVISGGLDLNDMAVIYGIIAPVVWLVILVITAAIGFHNISFR